MSHAPHAPWARARARRGPRASALLLAACGGGGGGTTAGSSAGASGGTLVIGTTDKITSLDPAGSYDNGSFAVMNQVYPFLLNTPYGSPDVQPDIADVGGVHLADGVHGQAEAGPEVGQRPRPHLLGREVHLRPRRQDRRPERPVVAAVEPRQRQRAGPHHRGLHAQGRERPDLRPGAVLPGRPDRRRGGLLRRRGDAGPDDRRRQGLRRAVHDRQLRREQPDPVQGATTATRACSARPRPAR